MAEYISYFIEDPRQLWTLGAVALLWIGMTAIGHLFVREDEETVFAPVIGWAVIVTTYTVLGTVTMLSFTTIALGLAAVALLSSIYAIRRGVMLFDPLWFRMIILAAPLLVLISAMQGSQWDEFSHWLTGQVYLLRTDMFPGDGRPPSSASFPAYPYGWQILGYLASRIAGFHLEAASSLINVLLLLTLGRVALGWALRAQSKTISDISLNAWVLAGLAGLSVILINPTFVQKVILTAYADSATSSSLALGFVLGIMSLRKLEAGDIRGGIRAAMISALTLSILVTLKQSTLELFLLAIIGLGAYGVSAGVKHIPRVIAATLAIAAPGIVLYVIWRAYVSANLTGEELSFLPFEEWNIDLIPTILTTMGYVLLKKSAYLLAVLIAIGWGLMVFRQRTQANRFMMAAALIFAGHITFLFLCYVAVFGVYEARTAASFWRYNQQLGGLAVLVLVMGVANILSTYGEPLKLQRLSYLPLVLLILAPFFAAHKLRFDVDPTYYHYRAVGRAMLEHVDRGQKVYLIDPEGSGESALFSQFETSSLNVSYPYLSSFHDHSIQGILNFWKQTVGTLVLIHSVTPEVNEALGQSFDDNSTYLVRSNADGSATIIVSWPWPKRG